MPEHATGALNLYSAVVAVRCWFPQPNVMWTPARPPKPLAYHPRTLGLILYEIGVFDTQLPLSGACSDSLQRVMVSLR